MQAQAKMTTFIVFLTGVASLLATGVGWVGLNFFGGPIVALRAERRKALEVTERCGNVGILTDTGTVLVKDTSLFDIRPRSPNESQREAGAEFSAAGNSLRTYVRNGPSQHEYIVGLWVTI